MTTISVNFITLDKEYILNDIDIDMNIYSLYLLFLKYYKNPLNLMCNFHIIIDNEIINPFNYKVKDFYKDDLLVINIIFTKIEYNITPNSLNFWTLNYFYLYNK